ncbi:MAG: prolyl oligopeptidase family serine peptidase [Planctomycetota bacterium]
MLEQALLLAAALLHQTPALPSEASAAPPRTPGGSAADYARAAGHRARFEGLVAGERLDAVWLGPTQLVVREWAGRQAWSFALVDAERATSEPAFDHRALARTLERALERPFDPAALPVRIVRIDGRRLDCVLDDAFEAFSVRRSGADLRALELADVPGALLEAGDSRRSGPAGGDTRVTFVNRATVPVSVLWLDGDGGARSYATLAPGERHTQSTYAGHVWLLRDEDGREHGPFEATPLPGLVQVTDEALAAAPDASAEAAPAPRPRALSPDGRWRVRSRRSAVELEEVASGERTGIALDDVPDGERTRQIVWSDDSTTFALLRSVDAETRKIHMVESSPTDRKQPRLHSMRYRKPGDAIDALRVVLVDVGSRAEVTIQDAGTLVHPWSIDRLRFAPDGSELWLRYNRRGHQVHGYYAIDVRSGALRAIVEERPETFVDYSQKSWMRHLEGRNELLWTSERSGHNHLYAVDRATGEARALTSGEWVLRAVDEVDEDAGTALVRGMGVYPDQDPYHVHFGRVDLVRGGVTWLTDSDGTHEIEWGPERRFYTATWSRVDQPPVHELRDARNGSLAVELGRADAEPLLAAGWRAPERFAAKGRDGTTDVFGVVHTPTGFDPNQRYPVIEAIYAGPHGHFVPKSWRVHRDVSQLVELGFVVVQIDGMGTNWRSKAFHDVCWRNVGDSGFPDRIAWLRAAAETRPWMDLERVGIYGGSAGGQSSTRALLAHGDVYSVAVSDCGCHDNRMDKIWWNEAWMGWPVGEHYAESSNVDLAHRLEGDLLLVVGELDRNVDPASTMQVVDALIRADKDFDLLVVPGAGHGAAESPYGRRRRQDHFVEHLMGVRPRWE